MLSALCLATARADLGPAKAEPNLEKRAEKALENASQLIPGIRPLYESGEQSKVTAVLAEIRESVDLAIKSLDDTGKNPRRSPKAFKKAELKTREIARRLDQLRQDFGAADRGPVEELAKHVHEVHDDLLGRLMRKK